MKAQRREKTLLGHSFNIFLLGDDSFERVNSFEAKKSKGKKKFFFALDPAHAPNRFFAVKKNGSTGLHFLHSRRFFQLSPTLLSSIWSELCFAAVAQQEIPQ